MTKEDIYRKHIDLFFAKDRNATFEDVPMSVFLDMMQEYADIEKHKNDWRERMWDIDQKAQLNTLITDEEMVWFNARLVQMKSETEDDYQHWNRVDPL